MVNYKNLYLEYKLKYINAKNQKQYGGFSKIRKIYETPIPRSTTYNKVTVISKFYSMDIEANKLFKKHRKAINDWKIMNFIMDDYSNVTIDDVNDFYNFLNTLWMNRNKNLDVNSTLNFTNNCNHCNNEMCICPDCEDCKEKKRECKCVITYEDDKEYIHVEENPDIYPFCFACRNRVGLNCSC